MGDFPETTAFEGDKRGLVGAKMTSIGSLHLREADRTFAFPNNWRACERGRKVIGLRYAPFSALGMRSTSILMNIQFYDWGS